MLEDIFSLDIDVLTVDFATLVDATDRFLARLADLCHTAPFDDVAAEPVNVSTRARFAWLSTLGWLSAVALRRLGLASLLQRIKDSRLVGKLFFKPLVAGQDEIRLSDHSLRILDDAHRECWSVVTGLSAQQHEGVFLRRATDADRS